MFCEPCVFFFFVGARKDDMYDPNPTLLFLYLVHGSLDFFLGIRRLTKWNDTHSGKMQYGHHIGM
jgi:hypothetical protein